MLGRIFLNHDVTKRGRIGIVGVADPIRQFNVEIARFLARWKIPGAVNRKSEHGRIICQNRCGAVALMRIAVQDRHAPDTAFCWHRQRSAAGFSMVAPAERRERSTICGVDANPIRRTSAGTSSPP